MPHNNWGPPRKAFASIGVNDGAKFACAAVMGLGDGFTVEPTGSFIALDVTQRTNGRRLVLTVNRNGIPTLIAALQQAHAEMTRGNNDAA